MTEGCDSDGDNSVDRPSTTITSNISKGQLFGPFSNPLHWLSFKSCDNNNNPSNELFSKIEIARHSDEQNLKIIHKNGNFYFKAISNISEVKNREEDKQNEISKLFAWFGSEFDNRLPKPSSSCLNGSTRYFCPLCNEVFLYSNLVVVHILCICPKRIQIDLIPVPSNASQRPSNSGSTQALESFGNHSAQQTVPHKPHISRKRGFDIASLVREESNESFPNKVLRNRNPSQSSKSEHNFSQSYDMSSAFHRPKSPSIRKSNPLTTSSSSIDIHSSPLLTSAFKKVDHRMSSITNPYEFSALYQRVATSSMLPTSTASLNHSMLSQMHSIPVSMPSPLPTSLAGTNTKSLVSNTLLPYLPPSLAALTFPTSNWCAKCNATFRMTSDLVYHMRSHHKGAINVDPMKKKREEKLRCNICNETFRERHHLTRHMTSHQ